MVRRLLAIQEVRQSIFLILDFLTLNSFREISNMGES